MGDLDFTGKRVLVVGGSGGTVIYARDEFETAGFEKVVDVILPSMMACALKFRALLAKAEGR